MSNKNFTKNATISFGQNSNSLRDIADVSMPSRNFASHPAYYPLSIEELSELQSLKEERKLQIKNLKLNKFKALSPRLRQIAIDHNAIAAAFNEIDSIAIPYSDRLKFLDDKDPTKFEYYADIRRHQPDPYFIEGITQDELEKAHLEQTIEEEILDEQSI